MRYRDFLAKFFNDMLDDYELKPDSFTDDALKEWSKTFMNLIYNPYSDEPVFCNIWMDVNGYVYFDDCKIKINSLMNILRFLFDVIRTKSV